MYDEELTQQDIDAIFNKYEEYVPEGASEEYPKYVATPKNCGPKPISIEEYRRRKNRNQTIEVKPQKQTKRGGKKLRTKKEKAEIKRLMGLTFGEEKRKLYIKLKSKNGQTALES